MDPMERAEISIQSIWVEFEDGGKWLCNVCRIDHVLTYACQPFFPAFVTLEIVLQSIRMVTGWVGLLHVPVLLQPLTELCFRTIHNCQDSSHSQCRVYRHRYQHSSATASNTLKY
jgi:hypothetical protein